MKLTLSPAAARRAALVAASAHAFCALALDAPALHNGAWPAALLGTLLALPMIALAGSRRGGLLPYVLLLLEGGSAALAADWLDSSAAFLALDPVHPLLLLAPPVLAAAWCALRNGDAVGDSASVGLKLSPLLLVPILLIQLPHLRPGWLFPLPGDAAGALLSGALGTAGRIGATFASAMLLSGEGGASARRWLRDALLAGLIATALLVLRGMMSPMLTNPAAAARLGRLDALLTNGRAPLYLQLPMLALWFAALLHALAYHVFAAAALLQRALPALDGRACVAAVALCVLALCGAGGVAALRDRVPAALPLAALGAALLIRRGREVDVRASR